MHTRFLNSCKALVTNQRRAQVIGQILCLMVIAAIFVLSPLVALGVKPQFLPDCVGMKGSGGGGGGGGGAANQNGVKLQNDKRQNTVNQVINNTKNVQIVGLIKQIDPTTDPKALNPELQQYLAQLPKGTATMDGSIELMPYNGEAIPAGTWLLMKQTLPTGTITYAATIFSTADINGKKAVEVWTAEAPLDVNVASKPQDTVKPAANPMPVGTKLFMSLDSFVTAPNIK